MTYRIFARGPNGEISICDYASEEALLLFYTKIGIEENSTDLSLRGMPLIEGLIGPMPDTENIIRYETPEVFEKLTREWCRPRRHKKKIIR